MKHSRYLLTALCLLSATVLWQALAQRRVSAHPVSQGFLEVVIFNGKVELRGKISVEEVLISNLKKVGDDDNYTMTENDYKKHAE
jgi:hypothetical protein